MSYLVREESYKPGRADPPTEFMAKPVSMQNHTETQKFSPEFIAELNRCSEALRRDKIHKIRTGAGPAIEPSPGLENIF